MAPEKRGLARSHWNMRTSSRSPACAQLRASLAQEAESVVPDRFALPRETEEVRLEPCS